MKVSKITDRRIGNGILKAEFPQIADMTSAEIQAFLNRESGCSVRDDMPNGIAFDLWRKAFAAAGRDHMWLNAQRLREIGDRTAAMQSEEAARQAAVT